MKRKKRIWIYILLVLLAAAAAVVIWQWQNIRAVHTVLTADEQTIAQELEATAQKEQEILDRCEISVTLPSMQQREDMIKGKISAEELKRQMGLLPADGEPDRPKPETAAQSAPDAAIPAAPEPPADPAARAAALVDECVRSLCAMQVDMLAQLASYRQDALDEWTALPEAERTQTRKTEIIFEGLDRCEALEKRSDDEVRTLLDRCSEELSSLGASTDIIDELWESYSEEKQATKTYFLSQYM